MAGEFQRAISFRSTRSASRFADMDATVMRSFWSTLCFARAQALGRESKLWPSLRDHFSEASTLPQSSEHVLPDQWATEDRGELVVAGRCSSDSVFARCKAGMSCPLIAICQTWANQPPFGRAGSPLVSSALGPVYLHSGATELGRRARTLAQLALASLYRVDHRSFIMNFAHHRFV